MAEELKVIALRRLQADGRQFQPGDEIPGALQWRALRRLTDTGYVGVVPKVARAPLGEYPEYEIIAHLKGLGYKVTKPKGGTEETEPQGS